MDTQNNTDTESSQQPGEILRPQLSVKTVRELITQLYGLKVTTIKEQNGYDDKNYVVTVEDSWDNPHMKELHPHGYVFKVLNALDSQKSHFYAEHGMQKVMTDKGFNCPRPVLNIYGEESRLVKIYVEDEDDRNQYNNNMDDDKPFSMHICRLLIFISGKLYHTVSYTPLLLYKTGVYLAQLHLALKDYYHPSLDCHNSLWTTASLPKLRKFVYATRGDERKRLLCDVISSFENEILPNLHHYQKGIIHGDYNEQNLIVQEIPDQELSHSTNKEHDIHGVIDFADAQNSYYVYELGICIMYMSVGSKIVDPMMVGGHILAGYLSLASINSDEFDALKICVAARYVTSLAMGEYTFSLDPSNEYVLICAQNGWPQLEKLWETPKEEVKNNWKTVMRSYIKAGKSVKVDIDSL